MTRRYFGTDGVRGVVGDSLTADLVERLGRAATIWVGGGAVLVGRDTRGSGPELEQALARGIMSAGGDAVLGGVLPTPAVALCARDLGAVVSASHNPPEYNGVKLFDREGAKLSDEAEEEIESFLDEPAIVTGVVERDDSVQPRYLAHVVDRFGTDLSALRIAVDCANGAYSDIAPEVFRGLGANLTVVGAEPDGSNINQGCGATDLGLLSRTVRDQGLDLGIAFDGDGDRILGVDLVAVTSMTNIGFHRLMVDRGIRVITTDVGDRYVLEALRREGGTLGGEQSGHIIWLRDHVTGDGLVAALLLCRALEGRPLADAAAVMHRYPQALENVTVSSNDIPEKIALEVERMNHELGHAGRILVRASGTEPVIRVLAEGQTREESERLCGTMSAL